jgi:hypothetical protein
VGPCYSCGQTGHYANRCPRKQVNLTPALGTNPNLNRNGKNSATTLARQNHVRAGVNHVAVEDVQAALDVIIDMILVNDNNAIVLFDSRASHSFVAAGFVQKYNLLLSMLKNRMIVSSLGVDMHARHVCPKVSILIRGLMLKKHNGLILGMDWLCKHNGLIDYAKKAVGLTPSSGKELEYVAESLVTDKAASNRIVLNHVDAASTLDIRTASEYPDVFLEELPSMSPYHEIEFVIELVPGTAPIFKRPYRMVANQFTELKEQL